MYPHGPLVTLPRLPRQWPPLPQTSDQGLEGLLDQDRNEVDERTGGRPLFRQPLVEKETMAAGGAPGPDDGRAGDAPERPTTKLREVPSAVKRGAADAPERPTTKLRKVPPAGPPPIAKEGLSPEQRRAAEHAIGGNSLFLTGGAGTGKSFLLRYIISELRKKHQRDSAVAVTAPTGIVATTRRVDHTLVVRHWNLRRCTGSNRRARLAKIGAVRIWRGGCVSGVDGRLIFVLCPRQDLPSRRADGSSEPFGGLQIIATGDFSSRSAWARAASSSRSRRMRGPHSVSLLGLGMHTQRESIRQRGDRTFANC